MASVFGILVLELGGKNGLARTTCGESYLDKRLQIHYYQFLTCQSIEQILELMNVKNRMFIHPNGSLHKEPPRWFMNDITRGQVKAVKDILFMRKPKPGQPGINQVNRKYIQGARLNLKQALHCNYQDPLSFTGPVEDFGVVAYSEVIYFDHKY